MPFTQLIYASEIAPDGFHSKQPISTQLNGMLERARLRNSEVAVTGILLFSGGHFLQVLEGRDRVLTTMYERIAADKRHRKVRRLARLEIPERLFGKWYMGLLNLDEQLELDDGMFARFQHRLQSDLDEHRARSEVLELLSEFKRRLDSDRISVSSAADEQLAEANEF